MYRCPHQQIISHFLFLLTTSLPMSIAVTIRVRRKEAAYNAEVPTLPANFRFLELVLISNLLTKHWELMLVKHRCFVICNTQHRWYKHRYFENIDEHRPPLVLVPKYHHLKLQNAKANRSAKYRNHVNARYFQVLEKCRGRYAFAGRYLRKRTGPPSAIKVLTPTPGVRVSIKGRLPPTGNLS